MLTQPILVDRDSPDSRKNTIDLIKQVVSQRDVFIFPEGTCTNRNSLINFKVGGFIHGMPIRPVAIDYHCNESEFSLQTELLKLICSQIRMADSFKLKALIQTLNDFDSVDDFYSWTCDGPDSGSLLMLLLCKWQSRMTITLLPVYTPSEVEKMNPKYAFDYL